MHFPKTIYQFADILKNNGFKCYIVGGAVRDTIMKRRVEDFDIATDAKPNDIMKLFKKVIPTGIKHGTVTVLFKNIKLEVTTFRSESDYSDGRHPEKVTFVPTIYEDLERRDFTINAIAYDLHKRIIIDPHNGRPDIKKKLIKAIGDPLKRFSEDGLRLLRACRFSSQLNFNVEEKTKQAIRASLPALINISKERIREEIIRVLNSDKPSTGFLCMHETGLLNYILPELEEGSGIVQRSLHCYDVFYHSLFSCDAAPYNNLAVRLSALLHDIGKPGTLTYDKDGEPRFHGHETLSADMAQTILKRLKFPNSITTRVVHLIKHHMFNYTDDWSDAALRRFIARVGQENIADLIRLRRADQIGTCNRYFISDNLIKLMDRIETIKQKDQALTIKDLNINGNDIMKAIGIKEGYKIGIILDFLLESVLEDPETNNRRTLINMAKNYYTERLKES
ncbi:MAG: HD domain-containing protein [Spirochaetes bacterium]|nr:HD domain-containing protein [Spirochaetota bacterium]